jgi:transcriptional regulator with XRE-family HTH domain
MPFHLQRFKRLRSIKSVRQMTLADLAQVAQSQISDCERGIGPTLDLLEKLATALDCTTDFLLGRTFVGVDNDDEAFREAVCRMAFDAFAERLNVPVDHKDRCRRVLQHHTAPITADAWAVLSEQIEMAIGPGNGDLRMVRGANS